MNQICKIQICELGCSAKIDELKAELATAKAVIEAARKQYDPSSELEEALRAYDARGK